MKIIIDGRVSLENIEELGRGSEIDYGKNTNGRGTL